MLSDAGGCHGEFCFAVCWCSQDRQVITLKGKRISVQIPITYTHLVFTFLFLYLLLLNSSLVFHGTITAFPKETDWLIDRKTPSRIECGRQTISFGKDWHIPVLPEQTLSLHLSYSMEPSEQEMSSVWHLSQSWEEAATTPSLYRHCLSLLLLPSSQLCEHSLHEPQSPQVAVAFQAEKMLLCILRTRNPVTFSGMTRCRTTRSGNSFINPGSHLAN